MAHAITALRVVLTIPVLLTICGASIAPPPWVAAILFAIIAASDIIDGRVARQAGTASAWGRSFDHGADIFFVLTTFIAYVSTGAARWWVPTSIALAFLLYVVDAQLGAPATSSRRLAGRIGHVGGVCNYIVIGTLIGNETVGLHLLPSVMIQLILGAVPLYSLASIVVRWLPSANAQGSTLSVR